jgi:hypothetical protein
MNKQITAAVRDVLKIGGAVLATSGLLPAQCNITDPTLAQSAGLISMIIGVAWAQVSSFKHQQLKEVVDATP